MRPNKENDLKSWRKGLDRSLKDGREKYAILFESREVDPRCILIAKVLTWFNAMETRFCCCFDIRLIVCILYAHIPFGFLLTILFFMVTRKNARCGLMAANLIYPYGFLLF